MEVLLKYFKHMSIMSDDTKIKRIKRKYGLKGYGLYVLLLEYISKQLDKHSPLPDLQEKAEDIADEWDCDIREVNEMMYMMVNEGLFEVHYITGQLVCTKLEKYLDEYIRKIPEIGDAIEEFRKEQERQMTAPQENSEVSDKIGENRESVRQTPSRIEETRLEQNRKEESRDGSPSPAKGKQKAMSTHEKTGKPVGTTQYERICAEWGAGTVDEYIKRAANYIAVKGKKDYKDYAAAAENYLLEDERRGKIERPKPKAAPSEDRQMLDEVARKKNGGIS